MNFARYIDHTLLKPDATAEEIKRLCEEAVQWNFYSVCVNSSRVALSAGLLKGGTVKIAAVTGFPLGAMTTESKAFETHRAIADGASEIDTVLAIGHLKQGDTDYVSRDLKAVVQAAEGHPVKVIFETCLLTNDEKVLACRLAVDAGAAFVKTSTGFSKGGATMEDVRLMHEIVAGACEVKASGGIRDAEMAAAMIDAGATRLGTSSGVAIVSGQSGKSGY